MVALAASISEKPSFDGVRWIFFLALSVLLNILILANIDINYNVKTVQIPEQIKISFRSLAGSASAPEPVQQVDVDKVETPSTLLPSQPVETKEVVVLEPAVQAPEMVMPDPELTPPVAVKTAQIDPVITKAEAPKNLPVIAKKVEKVEPPKPAPVVETVAVNAPRPRLKPRNLKVTQPVKVPAPKVVEKVEKKVVQQKPLLDPKPVEEARLHPERTVKPAQEKQKSNALDAASALNTAKTDLNEKGAGPSTIISEAQYKYRKPIVYPTQARRRGQQGKVKLHVLISESGRPMELKVVESSGFSLLDKAALAAVKKWEFIPPVTKNETQLSWVSVPVDFVLRR